MLVPVFLWTRLKKVAFLLGIDSNSRRRDDFQHQGDVGPSGFPEFEHM
jgi:hypothetical protein